MNVKEKNFISAVVYVRNAEKTIKSFLQMLSKSLENNFEKYEIICVDDCSTDRSVKCITEFGDNLNDTVLSIIHMSYYQGLEISMNAGIDLTIGDFVFEFDEANCNFETDVITQVYKKALSGFDIVSASPNDKMKASSKYFYKLFNKYSNNPNKLQTEEFRILSRRGINRIHSMSKTIPYRKAVYAGCGLRSTCIKYDSCEKGVLAKKDDLRWNTAIDALILFTNLGYRISLCLTFIMMIATMLSGAYTVYVFLSSAPIAGWTTTMLLMSFSFFGLFVVLAIIIKYLSVLIGLTFNKQKYVIEGIDKITK